MKYVNFVLTLLSIILALLLTINTIVARSNGDLFGKVNNEQQALSAARNNELELRTLTIRIAQGSVKDNLLRDLLVKHQLKATIDVNGQQKDVP